MLTRIMQDGRILQLYSIMFGWRISIQDEPKSYSDTW